MLDNDSPDAPDMRATISGSFRRGMPLIREAVEQLSALGVQVLSPAVPEVVAEFGDFLFVASDKLRNVRLVQDRHNAAIQSSDFVWLVAPEGYVGLSAAFEVGLAHSYGVPVYAEMPPDDQTVRQYVSVVKSPAQALLDSLTRSSRRHVKFVGIGAALLIDPQSYAHAAHREIEHLEQYLLTAQSSFQEDDPDIRQRMEMIGIALRTPPNGAANRY